MRNKAQNFGNLRPLIITINLMVLLIFGNALQIGYKGHAAENDNAQPKAAEEEVNPTVSLVEGQTSQVNAITKVICEYELTKAVEPEFRKYQLFMDDNFKNKSSTSSLLQLGIKRYENFKEFVMLSLDDKMQQQIAVASNSSATNFEQIPGLNNCESKAKEYIENAAKILELTALRTSSAKKASLFVEKYKQINSKLSALDLKVMQMTGYIATFEQKLPCYLKTCI